MYLKYDRHCSGIQTKLLPGCYNLVTNWYLCTTGCDKLSRQDPTQVSVCFCVACYVHVACMYCMSCSSMWLSFCSSLQLQHFYDKGLLHCLIMLWVNVVVVYVVNHWLHTTQGHKDWQPCFIVSSKSLYQTTRCPANAWKFDRNQEQRHVEQTALECASNRIVPAHTCLVYWSKTAA